MITVSGVYRVGGVGVMVESECQGVFQTIELSGYIDGVQSSQHKSWRLLGVWQLGAVPQRWRAVYRGERGPGVQVAWVDVREMTVLWEVIRGDGCGKGEYDGHTR